MVVWCGNLIGYKYEVDLDVLSSDFMSGIYITPQALRIDED